MSVEASQDARKITVRMVGADGNVMNQGGFSVKYDGKDYPVTGSPAGGAVSIKKIDDRSTESTWKRNGKVVSTELTAVSADGKTITTTTKPASGQGPTIIHVWERQ